MERAASSDNARRHWSLSEAMKNTNLRRAILSRRTGTKSLGDRLSKARGSPDQYSRQGCPAKQRQQRTQARFVKHVTNFGLHGWSLSNRKDAPAPHRRGIYFIGCAPLAEAARKEAGFSQKPCYQPGVGLPRTHANTRPPTFGTGFQTRQLSALPERGILHERFVTSRCRA